MGSEDRVARTPAEQDGVKRAEQARRRQRRRRWAPGQVQQPVVALDQLGCDRLQSGTDVAQWQPGPPCEIALVGRSVSAQVTTGQLGQGQLAVDPRRLAQPIAHERVGVIAPAHRAAHGQPARGGEPEQVDQRLALRADTARGDALAQLLAGERALVGEAMLDDLHGTFGGVGRDPLLSQSSRVARSVDACGERVQPGVVLAAHEVQRAAVEPGDHQRALVAQGPIDVGGAQAAAPRADRESHAAWVLSLDRQESLGDGNGIAGWFSRSSCAVRRSAIMDKRPLFALAEDEFLDLAGRGLRQRAELDGVGALVVGEPLAAERDELLGVALGPALRVTNAFGRSPQRSWGIAITAHSSTAG